MQKQNLLLIGDRPEITQMYYNDLVKLFTKHLNVFCYARDTEKNYLMQDLVKKSDILVVTRDDIFEDIRGYISDSCVIIHLQSDFLKEKIDYLKNLPNKTKALVCFHSYLASTQIVATLYGYTRNLVFEAYNIEEKKTVENYDIILIGENSAHVPVGNHNIYNLGIRKISLATLFSIANAGDINSEDLEREFVDYSKDIYKESENFTRFYDIFSVNKLQLKTIMDRIDYSVIICDENYRILDFNQNVKEVFSITKNITRLHLSQVEEFAEIYNKVSKEKVIKNLLMEYKRKYFMLSLEEIFSPWKLSNYILILIKDVTKIMSLEKSFKQQLIQKGHVSVYTFDNILGKTSVIKECVSRAMKISKIDKTILITGESGTGKELFAQSIHNFSDRKDYPFLALNCAALPSTLLESELFGYVDGSFSGAKKGGRSGLFQMANKGTFFLDEIGDISLETQVKLLRVLEEKKIMPIGSGEIIPIDVRVIAATNKNLRQLVKEGKFRLDLYYRLNTLELFIPPVKERKEDIPLLINHIIQSEKLPFTKISEDLMDFFKDFNWPGNIREMKNCIEYMCSISEGELTLNHLPKYILDEYREECSATSILSSPISSSLKIFSDDLFKEILTLIKNNKASKLMILEILREKNFPITDYKLRNILKLLNEKNYVKIGVGRQGMLITEKGINFLNNEF